jgi:hypothetical protein
VIATARTVYRDGIRCHGLRYLALTLTAYVGEEVNVRYDLRDLAEIRVFYRNQFLLPGPRQYQHRTHSSVGLPTRGLTRRPPYPATDQPLTHRCMGAVDRYLVPVGAAEAGDLGVQVGKQPRLQQRVVGEVDTGNQIRRIERDLLGLGEVVHRVAVQRQRPDDLDRRS